MAWLNPRVPAESALDGVGLGSREELVVLVRRPDGHPRSATTGVRERPDDHLLLLTVCGECGGPVLQRQPDEVGLGRRHFVAEPTEGFGDPLPLADHLGPSW